LKSSKNSDKLKSGKNSDKLKISKNSDKFTRSNDSDKLISDNLNGCNDSSSLLLTGDFYHPRLNFVAPVEILITEGIDVFVNHILNILNFEDIIRIAMASKMFYALLSEKMKPTRIQTNRPISSLQLLKTWITNSRLTTLICPNLLIVDEDINLLPPTLTVLDLGFDQNLTNTGIKNLPRDLKQLGLCYSNIGNAGLSYLPPHLTHLSIKYGNKITDLGLKYLPRTLTHLELPSNTTMTDKGLKNLPPNLLHLDLRDNQYITNEGLKYLPLTLNYLNLHSNLNISDEGLNSLPPSLTYLDLHSTRSISDQGLSYLHAAVLLNYLDLYSNKKITQSSMKYLPQINSFYVGLNRVK